jgi:hypothetical protein
MITSGSGFDRSLQNAVTTFVGGATDAAAFRTAADADLDGARARVDGADVSARHLLIMIDGLGAQKVIREATADELKHIARSYFEFELPASPSCPVLPALGQHAIQRVDVEVGGIDVNAQGRLGLQDVQMIAGRLNDHAELEHLVADRGRLPGANVSASRIISTPR